MKKLNLYSKSNIERNHLINCSSVGQTMLLFSLLAIIIYIVSVFWSIPYLNSSSLPIEHLITALKTQHEWNYHIGGDMYIFSATVSSFYPMLLGIPSALLFVPLTIYKSYAVMELSLGIKRKKIFTDNVMIPLVITSLLVIIVNVIVLILNLKYVGYHDILLPAFLGNLLYDLKLFLIGAILPLTTLLVPKRFIDKLICILGFIMLSNVTLYCDRVFSLFLKGRVSDDEISRIIGFFSPWSDYRFKNDIKYSYSFSVNDSVESAIGLLLYSLAWVILGIAVILLLRRYFIKGYKVEDHRKRDASKLATILPCFTISLFPAILFLRFRISGNLLYNNLEFYWDEILISLLIIWAVSIVLSIIITWNPKKFYLGVISAGICTVITFVCCAIGATGAFDYSQYVPEPQEIKNVYVSTMLNGFTKATNNLYFFSYPSTKEDFNIQLESEKDIEIITDIHKKIVSSDELDAAAYCFINYELKDGTVISRRYDFINEAAADEMYRIFETDFAKNFYGQLLNIPEVMQRKEGNALIPYDRLTYKNVHVIAKDNTATCITDKLTYQQINELKYALYNDICNISAEDWFKPDEQYGALAISNIVGNDGKISNSDPISYNNADEHGQFYFFITPEMTNTVNFLEKYDYMKYFELKKQVKSVHLVDIRDLSDWEREFNMVEKTALTEDGRPLCTYHLTWNNFLLARYVEVCVLGNTDYLEKFDPDVKPPKTTDIPIEKATEYLEDSFLSYNVGSSGKILATTYTDGTYNTVILPE